MQPCQRGKSLTFHGMNNEQQAELERLERVLEVAKRNRNKLFIQNIEREIAAVQRGEHSPLIVVTSQRKNGHQGASTTSLRLETN